MAFMRNDPSFPISASPLRRAVRAFCTVLPVLCVLIPGAGAALAQQPTAAQKNAIKSACRADFIAQCSGVTPGGLPALQCLQKHNDSLSPACQKAIGALSGKSSSAAPATAAPQTAAVATAPAAAAPAVPMRAFSPREEIFIARRSCGPDFRAYCAAVPLGGGRGIDCLRQNAARLSASCKQVLAVGL